MQTEYLRKSSSIQSVSGESTKITIGSNRELLDRAALLIKFHKWPKIHLILLVSLSSTEAWFRRNFFPWLFTGQKSGKAIPREILSHTKNHQNKARIWLQSLKRLLVGIVRKEWGLWSKVLIFILRFFVVWYCLWLFRFRLREKAEKVIKI